MKLLSVLLGFLMLTGSANAIDAVAAFDDPTFAYIDNAWIATRGRVPL